VIVAFASAACGKSNDDPGTTPATMADRAMRREPDIDHSRAYVMGMSTPLTVQ
jgi:hypothetical protein